jgi:hypothetical protein
VTPPRFSHRPSQLPPSESDAPPSAGHYDQEFLYHLYRGSELLQDNSVDLAKAELERALKLQPKDIEGQGLLGIVYFRLGLYPRAIEIYEQLQVTVPLEVTPRINLALCYLKTAQTELARAQLEEVIRLAPEHQRAWGYLGLVFQRFGDFDKARIAFERAGRPKLAERMAELCSPAVGSEAGFGIAELGSEQSPVNLGPVSFRPSLMPQLLRPEPPPSARLPQESLPPPLTSSRASLVPSRASQAPGSLSAPSLASSLQVPTPLNAWARDAELVFPESPRLVLNASGAVLARVQGSLAVRPEVLGGLSPDRVPFATQPLPLTTPLVSLVGSGRALLIPSREQRFCLFDVDRDTPVFWLQERLVAFEPELRTTASQLDSGRGDSATVVVLSGEGCLVGWSKQAIQTLLVSPERPLTLRAELLVGWFGQLSVRPLNAVEAPAGLSPMLNIVGRGTLLIDPAARET